MKRHDQIARLARQARAWDLTCQGWTQSEIAVELGVHQATISKWLKAAEAGVLKRFDARVLAQKAAITAKLEFTYREAITAWRASRAERTKKLRRTHRKDGAEHDIAQVITEQSAGDAALLGRAQEALREIVKVWGLYAPTRTIEETVPPDRPLEDLSDADLRAALLADPELLAHLKGPIV